MISKIYSSKNTRAPKGWKPPSREKKSKSARLRQGEIILAEAIREQQTPHERIRIEKERRMNQLMRATNDPAKARYIQYLASEEWRIFRLSVIAKRGLACEVCRTRQNSPQLHHLTYERLGCERETDVIVTCETCHRRYHGLPSIAEMQAAFVKEKTQQV